MNRTDTVSQNTHYAVAKISSEPSKEQNSINSNSVAAQNDDVALGHVGENDRRSNGSSTFPFHSSYHYLTFLLSASFLHFSKHESF